MLLCCWRLLLEGVNKSDRLKSCSFLSASFLALTCFRMYCQAAHGTIYRNDQNWTLHCCLKQVREALVYKSPELQLLRFTVEHPLPRPQWMFPGIWLVTGSLQDGYRRCRLPLEQFSVLWFLGVFTQSMEMRVNSPSRVSSEETVLTSQRAKHLPSCCSRLVLLCCQSRGCWLLKYMLFI